LTEWKSTFLKGGSLKTGVIIEKEFKKSLTILPEQERKLPLRWGLHRVELEFVGVGVAMKYHAELTNAKPPGEIVSRGNFGRWVAPNRETHHWMERLKGCRTIVSKGK